MQDFRIALILGGARSGKSRYAEALAAGHSAVAYIATAEAYDDEMRARIAQHRARRPPAWKTREVPLALPEAIAGAGAGSLLLVDCLTLWLSNMLLAERDLDAETDRLCAALLESNARILLVSNEVGLGIVPDNALARRFRDAAGILNQRVAALADHVVLMTAGLPSVLKSEPAR